ncbi:hypothetical protein GPJ56_007332 [Histomonas meleagridis]|uniref:uncharacterized protein n=1 Tax=Histomonas meleagridis TaxID=135588 RepID=UPI00355A36C7|nr:hypothetical protein GPJ56_007332 [Histomonas meleagridis]KAH0804178.1 hypothetical protein GO595_003008 [Histomonas meleagridis]
MEITLSKGKLSIQKMGSEASQSESEGGLDSDEANENSKTKGNKKTNFIEENSSMLKNGDFSPLSSMADIPDIDLDGNVAFTESREIQEKIKDEYSKELQFYYSSINSRATEIQQAITAGGIIDRVTLEIIREIYAKTKRTQEKMNMIDKNINPRELEIIKNKQNAPLKIIKDIKHKTINKMGQMNVKAESIEDELRIVQMEYEKVKRSLESKREEYKQMKEEYKQLKRDIAMNE